MGGGTPPGSETKKKNPGRIGLEYKEFMAISFQI